MNLEMLCERLRNWAQNEEMVDQYYTKHGQDCIEAARELEKLRVFKDETCSNL